MFLDPFPIISLVLQLVVASTHQYHFLVIVARELIVTTLCIWVSCITMVENCTPPSWLVRYYVIYS